MKQNQYDQSEELEREVGDDSEAYLIDDDEVDELLSDNDESPLDELIGEAVELSGFCYWCRGELDIRGECMDDDCISEHKNES